VLLTSLAAIWCSAGSASGVTHTVLNINDFGAGSLRDAILNANAGGGGELVFAPSVAGTITLSTDLPSLTANVTITGPGANLLTISGANEYRVFSTSPNTTNKLSGLTIADGWAAGYPHTFASGISNGGSLKLADCVITNCLSVASYGMGIFNAGTLEMERCLVADCHDPSFFGSGSPGGGVFNAGTLTMTNCTISNCGSPAGGGGGGIYNSGELLMRGSAVVDCFGGHEGDGGGISSSGEATLITCIVSNCSGTDGGGILIWHGTLWMTNCSVLDNDAFDGAGILSLAGNAVLNGCTVAGNLGGIVGGSVDNLGAMQLYNCTVSGNTMPTDPFVGNPAKYGSGISDGFLYGHTGPTTLLMQHCTVVSNSGPVQVWTVNSITSDYSILSNCVGTLDSSAGHNLIMTTNGCVLTNNTTGNLYNVNPLLGPLQNNGGPTLTHALLISRAHPVHSQRTLDRRGFPKELQDLKKESATFVRTVNKPNKHVIGSPALNAAGSADPTPTDQRGVARPQGPASDIGAFEFSYKLPVLVRMTKQPFSNPSLQWSGLPGSACTVQASTNCRDWANVTNLVLSANGILEFIDADAAKYPSRFYRLTMPVPPGSP
jgi:hypothetical protein